MDQQNERILLGMFYATFEHIRYGNRDAAFRITAMGVKFGLKIIGVDSEHVPVGLLESCAKEAMLYLDPTILDNNHENKNTD